MAIGLASPVTTATRMSWSRSHWHSGSLQASTELLPEAWFRMSSSGLRNGSRLPSGLYAYWYVETGAAAAAGAAAGAFFWAAAPGAAPVVAWDEGAGPSPPHPATASATA